jgi:membrane protease YdiL (CAAX protease family)
MAAVLLIARPADGQTARSTFTRTDALEVGAVAATGVGHIAFSKLDQSRLFIPLAGLGWGNYFYHQYRTEPGFLSRLGLRSGNLRPAFRDASLVALGSAAAMAGYAASQDQLRLHRDMIWLLLLYPSWGLLQQTLTQGMGADNLRELPGAFGSPLAVTLTTAALFGAVHVPNWELAGATTALGLVFTPLYLKYRNLWPLGLYHGWLGALFYFWVLNDNPWRDITGLDDDPSKIRGRLSPGLGGGPSLGVRIRF